MLETSLSEGGKPTVWVSPAVAAGPKIGLTFGYTWPGQTGLGLISRQLNLGGGLPAGPFPINGSAGASHTSIIYDFYR